MRNVSDKCWGEMQITHFMFCKFLSQNPAIYDIIIFIISIQPLGQFEQESKPNQATGMAVVCCILGKFLGVVCHCFPPYAM